MIYAKFVSFLQRRKIDVKTQITPTTTRERLNGKPDIYLLRGRVRVKNFPALYDRDKYHRYIIFLAQFTIATGSEKNNR